MSNNSVRVDGGHSLALARRVNTSPSLNWCDNSIGDEGANSLDQDQNINPIRSSLEFRPIRSNHLQTHRLFVVDPHRTMMTSVHFERGRSANS